MPLANAKCRGELLDGGAEGNQQQLLLLWGGDDRIAQAVPEEGEFVHQLDSAAQRVPLLFNVFFLLAETMATRMARKTNLKWIFLKKVCSYRIF
jgi:hypothetical protein